MKFLSLHSYAPYICTIIIFVAFFNVKGAHTFTTSHVYRCCENELEHEIFRNGITKKFLLLVTMMNMIRMMSSISVEEAVTKE